MKSVEELTVTKGTISYLPQIYEEILKDLEAKMVGAQLFKMDYALVGGGGEAKRYRYEADTTIVDPVFADNAALPDVVSPTQTYTTITVENFGFKETIEKKAEQVANYNLVEDKKDSLVKLFAREKDKRYWKTILNPTAVTLQSCSPATGDGSRKIFKLTKNGSAWQGLVLKVTDIQVNSASVILGVDVKVDFYDGLIEFVTAPGNALTVKASFEYTDRTCVDAITKAQASFADLVNARNTMIGSYGSPNTVVLNPNEAMDLIVDDKFLAAAANPQGQKTVLTGQINHAAGLDILESQLAYEGVITVVEKGSIGYELYAQKLVVETEPVAGTMGNKYLKLWDISKPGITRPTLIVLVLNCHQYAKDLTYA